MFKKKKFLRIIAISVAVLGQFGAPPRAHGMDNVQSLDEEINIEK